MNMEELKNIKLLFNGATDSTGYGNVGASYLKQLWDVAGIHNIKVQTDYNRIDDVHGKEFEKLLRHLVGRDIGQPDIMYNLWNPMCSRLYDIETPQIIETIFETNLIQENWVTECNGYDQTWVASKFSAKAFEDSGVANVKYMPYGFDFWDDDGTIPKIVNDKRFKFLFINQWSNRKFAKETVDAFCKTFTKKDNVVLYIRTFVLGGLGLTDDNIWLDIKTIKDKYPDSPQIILLQYFDDSKLPKLYNSVDCLLSPSRGEGVGRTIVEAMGQGVPVITTNWSAMTEYCTKQNSMLLDYDLVKVNVPPLEARTYYFENPDMVWAEPSIDQLIEFMQYAVSNKEDLIKLGETASTDVRAYFNWDNWLPLRLDAMRELL